MNHTAIACLHSNHILRAYIHPSPFRLVSVFNPPDPVVCTSLAWLTTIHTVWWNAASLGYGTKAQRSTAFNVPYYTITAVVAPLPSGAWTDGEFS
ncbi:hypothetical protein EYZ11_010467 [Aspergillus tanneri]|uniref:Uncharacterized protein n=1 Tax=Aspergillus tanneri TaxID=1220188 RepID=A0A4S3JAN6_9EURO|nr:hypothetical protein EYZ11_010467 [Aspergillus tanneri]